MLFYESETEKEFVCLNLFEYLTLQIFQLHQISEFLSFSEVFHQKWLTDNSEKKYIALLFSFIQEQHFHAFI